MAAGPNQGFDELGDAVRSKEHFLLHFSGDHMRNIFTAVIIVMAILLLASPALAEMYKWVDKNGVVHYSDTPPATPEKDVETIETPRYSQPSPKSDSAKSRMGGKKELKSEPKKTVSSRKSILGQYANKVVIFTTSWCVHCKKAVAFLKSNGIRFKQYDLEKDGKAAEKMMALGGSGGVPYAVIKGRPVTGFSEDIYKKALGLR